eukprot:TRINITY_DN20637_c0_g1_i1.p1 TRINITY_DN20637_c0_g1~~TRINITY_DN20637_c0_g1_i1.p1  ORF type:complete len:772 (+),score=267.05 TRINITY_DN20637_c0_g1_i1:298-2316(+)
MWSQHIIHVLLQVTLAVFQLAFMLSPLNNMQYKLRCLDHPLPLSYIEILLSAIPCSMLLHLVFLVWIGFHPQPNMKLKKPLMAYTPPGVPDLDVLSKHMKKAVSEHIDRMKSDRTPESNLDLAAAIDAAHPLGADLPAEYKAVVLTTMKRLYEPQFTELSQVTTTFLLNVRTVLKSRLGYGDTDVTSTILNRVKEVEVASPLCIPRLRRYQAEVMHVLQGISPDNVPEVLSVVKNITVPEQKDPVNMIDFADVKASLKVKCIRDKAIQLSEEYMTRHAALEDELGTDIINEQLKCIEKTIPSIVKNVIDYAGECLYEKTLDGSMQSHFMLNVTRALSFSEVSVRNAENVPTALRSICQQIQEPLNEFLTSYNTENMKDLSTDVNPTSYLQHVHGLEIDITDVVRTTVLALPPSISDILTHSASQHTINASLCPTGLVLPEIIQSQQNIYHQLFRKPPRKAPKEGPTLDAHGSLYEGNIAELLAAHHERVLLLMDEFEKRLLAALRRIENKVKPVWLDKNAALKLASVGLGIAAVETSGGTSGDMETMDRNLENNMSGEGVLVDFAPPSKVDCSQITKPMVMFASLLRMYPSLSKLVAVILGIFMLAVGMVGFVAFSTWYNSMFVKFDTAGKTRFTNTYGVMLWLIVCSHKVACRPAPSLSTSSITRALPTCP